MQTTVELFAGIGGFRIAADRKGLHTVWANDICPKACKVYRNRFGLQELIEGDIHNLKDRIPCHDILTAGFPCQPFSSAGKKNGLRDPRGSLFQVIVDVLLKCKPHFFVLENVKRLLTMEKSAHFATMLHSLTEIGYRIEWRLVNLTNLGIPQNRERVIIVGTHDLNSQRIKLASGGDLQELPSRQVQILEDPRHWREIEHHKKFSTWGIAERGNYYSYDLVNFSDTIKMKLLAEVLQKDTDASFDFTANTIERIENSDLVNKLVDGVQILYNQNGGARMGYTVFGIEGVVPTLTATASRHYERYKIGNRFRRLTNVEYARLQGFSDDHCSCISTYDQYQLFGNAVPPPIVEWAFGKILQDSEVKLNPFRGQLSFPLKAAYGKRTA